MSNVVSINKEVDEAIKYLTEEHKAGRVKGVIITFTDPDGDFDFYASNLTYIEKLGLLQAGIDTVNRAVDEE